MTDPFVPRSKIYKKKRVFEGQNWDQSETINELEAAKRAGRQFCKGCRKFKPWSKLHAKYDRLTKKRIQQVWFCEDCGTAVKDTVIYVGKRRKEE